MENDIVIKRNGKIFRLTKEVGGKHWEVRGIGPEGTTRTYINKKAATKAIENFLETN